MSVTKQQLELNAESVLSTASLTGDPKQQFCQIWNGVLRPALELVKHITGPRIDKIINELEKAADGVCSGTNPDIQNFCKVWNAFHIESILKIIEVFVGPNVKKAIDKFIEIADSLCPATN